MVLIASAFATHTQSAHEPAAMHAAPFPARAPAAELPPSAIRAAFLARRRALIASRAAALCMTVRRVPAALASEPGEVELFHPAPRCSLLRAGDAEPVLTAAERGRLALDVAMARDSEEWQIGRATPCRWLTLPGANA